MTATNSGLKLTEEHDVLAFASYCGDDNPLCSDCAPCPRCLGMSNVFRAKLGAYQRELAPAWNHDDEKLKAACQFDVDCTERDAKGEEIARLKEEIASRETHYCAAKETWFELLAVTGCRDGGELQNKAERTDSAEARLAAMASVTEAATSLLEDLDRYKY